MFSDPFKHFEINEPLTQSAIDEICNAEIADPRKQNLNYDGTRALMEEKENLEQELKMAVKLKNSDVMLQKKTQINFLI